MFANLGWSAGAVAFRATGRYPSGQMRERKRRILIVDDDPSILESLDILLQSWGFDVLQAGDAHEAKDLVDRHEPDIVIPSKGRL